MKKITCMIALALLISGCGSQSTAAVSPESSASSEPAKYACRLVDYYPYSDPVPSSDAADDSYYDSALFAGDSRMGALYLYGTHKNAQVEYVTSLNLFLIGTTEADNHDDGTTLEQILLDTDRSNIYLMFGINEIRNTESYFDNWIDQYQTVVSEILEAHPDASVYVILTYHPDSISGLEEPDLSEHLQWINTRLINLAEKNYIYYLDTDNGLDDENGTIRDEYVADGLHFTPEGAHAFEDYIATHIVRSENYVKEVCD